MTPACNLQAMQLTLEHAEIRALIRLLDDPDSDVYKNVFGRLVSFGKTVIPMLETEWDIKHHQTIQTRIESIIDEIEFEECCQELENWCNNESADLLNGLLIAGKFQYPEADLAIVKAAIERIRKDIWLELNDNLTSLEKARVINHILFDVHHFKPYNKYHQSFQSYYLINLIVNGSGSPFAISALYKVLADELNLPIVGLNLPDHFILGYVDIYNHLGNDVLFYINPFSKGAVFGRGELERYIEKSQLDLDISELKPMSNIAIVKRMLSEVYSCYQRLGKYRKLDQANTLINILKQNNKLQKGS